MTGRSIRADVVVIGDGPAGSALAQACHGAGLGTVLVGANEPWTATYSTWIDDLPPGLLAADPSVFSFTVPTIDAYTDRHHVLQRAYAVVDNPTLRATLRTGVEHLEARVERVEPGVAVHHVILADGRTIGARLVIDAGGWPSAFAPRAAARMARGSRPTGPAWQTAFGVVLAEPPPGDLGMPVVMDFRPARASRSTMDDRRSTLGPVGVTTFGYSLPVADGWLVEETVLAARPAIEPVALVARLAARLGLHPDELLAQAVRSEFVRIPMGGALPSPDQPVVAFGAAAGYVHPATGYSLAGSLRLAERVGVAIVASAAGAASDHVIDSEPVWDAVWSTSMRRTRVFHDFGLDMLLRLDTDGVREFFGSFFELPVERWTGYLRVDTPPMEIASVMAELFRSSSWTQRRRLAGGNPATLAGLLRP
jgi:lycopene beta-cyclase